MIHLGVKKIENERKDAIKIQVSKIYSGRRSTPPHPLIKPVIALNNTLNKISDRSL